MKKMTRKSIVFFSFILLISSSLTVYAAANEKVQQAAQEGLVYFLEKIPVGMEKNYGFNNRQEFDWAFLGEPYELYTIPPDSLINEQPIGAGFLTPLEIWRFPVISQDSMRTLLTVAKMWGEWKAVSIGGTGIALELDQLEKMYSFDRNNTKRVMVRLFQIKSDFITICNLTQEIEDAMFVPLQSARMQMRLGEAERLLYSLPELVPILQKKIKSVILDFPIDEQSKLRKNVKKKDM
ncbi:MAG: hypothetical protein MUP98_01540 [Candidatus Aminicenantes bacterium]|nr:hypothetical protein [Candidatus Aminicenantes bacterium]